MLSTLIPYILLHSLNLLLLKYVALLGLDTPHTLFFRGLGCLSICVFFSIYRRRSLIPTEPKAQLIRFLVAGASLYLLTESFHFARATTVGTLSRLDTAFLLVLGPLAGVPANRLRRFIAFGLVFIVVFFAVSARGPDEQIVGYLLALLATAGLTFGFILMKRTGAKETVEVVAMVAALALIFYGGLGTVTRGSSSLEISTSLLAIFSALLSGVCMFAIYALTLRLYRSIHIALAEYPTLLSTIIVLPLEQALFKIPITSLYLSSIVAQLLVLGVLLFPSNLLGKKFFLPKRKEIALA